MPRLHITLPVYNEEAQLAASVGRLTAFLASELPLEREIVIVDNGSTDGTLAVAKELERTDPAVRVLHLPLKGRGRALRAAWNRSGADIMSYMDIDLSTDLAALPPLVEALVSGGYDLGTGTRLHPESVVQRCWKRELISRGYNRLLRLALRVRFSDAQCGFKALTREAAQRLLPLVEDNEWFFDTELLVTAQRLGCRIFEQPVRWIEDPDSRVRLASAAWADVKGMWRLARQKSKGGTSHSQPATRNQPRATRNQPRATSHEPRATSHEPRATSK